MRKLNNFLKASILALTIPLFTSYKITNKQIPLEKKLREIENDKYILNVVDCKHKTWRYYINTRMVGEKMNIVVGWMNNQNVLHAYLKDKEGRIFDPTWKSNIDGVKKEENINRKDIYVYGLGTTIEDYVNYNYISKDTAVYNEFRRTHPNPRLRKISREEIVKSIKKYCKQDTNAWNYYLENIAKNKE